jgi:hypothetical protein
MKSRIFYPPKHRKSPRRRPAPARSEISTSLYPLPASLRASIELFELLLTPLEALYLFTCRSVRQFARDLLRRTRMKELRPTPSLRGTPKPADIDEIWALKPRTLLDRLRLGSRLLDLEPAVDNSFVFREYPHSGRREIIARHSGIKGWLQDHCPTVAYTTAMAWKKLASRLKPLCGAPANIPLEWLLPNAPEISTLTSDPALADAITAARRRLDGFLAEGKTFSGLQKLAEKRMNIIRFPSKKLKNSLILKHGGPKSEMDRLTTEFRTRGAVLLAALQQLPPSPERQKLLRHLALLQKSPPLRR